MTFVIDLGSDFSRFPFGRLVEDGPYSAAVFRDTILKPALDSYQVVEVDLSNASGLGSSFLDGVFGVLVVDLGWSFEDYKKRLIIKSEKLTFLPDLIDEYVSEALKKA